jgi:protein arginine phosphatase
MRLLTVCTGNICRSPMAAALLRRHLDARRCDDVEVVSAGTWAEHGSPASSGAQHVMRNRGIDISGHRSQPLETHHVDSADLVIVMTSVHVREVLDLEPAADRKIFMIKEFPELEPARRDGPLESILGGRRPDPRRSLDVDDPIGLPVMAYERCFRELESGVVALLDVLCPQNSGGGPGPP